MVTDSTQRSPAERLRLMAAGLLLITTPALTLGTAYLVLRATGSAVFDGLTVVEAVELYLVELVAFAVFGYLLYRITLFGVKRAGG